jgi:hypothetical protein
MLERLNAAVLAMLAAVLLTTCTPSSNAPRASKTPGSPRVSSAPDLSLEQLPVPQSYARTCVLVGSWCQASRPGHIPTSLRRPLHLPHLGPSGRCPTSRGRRFSNSQFGGTALGPPPLQPLIVGGPAASVNQGVITFGPSNHRGWYAVKTLWFARPNYQGPAFLRGRQLDGRHKIVFGEAPSLIDPQLPPGPTLNGMNGWREWPGGTWLRAAGCYAWQIDGLHFSHVVVFQARFAR